MSKLFVVFGATGQQGGSIISVVSNDPQLSKEYKIRAVTRDPGKPAGQRLKEKGCEVIAADVDDKASIEAALIGAHTVFSVTVSIYAPGGKEGELEQAKIIADVAVAAGVEYYILSTMPSITKHSNGTLCNVGTFDVKEEVETYVRSLPLKSAFFSPSPFMQNFSTFSKPYPNGDDTYACTNLYPPSTKVTLIDIATDTGKFVGTILADSENTRAKPSVARQGCIDGKSRFRS